MQDLDSRPTDVRRILVNMQSLEQLEVLLVLAADPDRPHTVSELLERAAVRPEDLLEIMGQLVAKGLVVRGEDGAWRMSKDKGSVNAARELLRAYRRDPVPIVRAIVQASIERARDIAGWASVRLFREG